MTNHYWDRVTAPHADRDRTEPPTARPHCEGHGGPGRWYCCQHPDAGWPCPENVEDES